jgi:predicted nucleic acid-binding protein
MENWTTLSVKKGRRFGMGDLLIAAISAENEAKVWSLDEDFSRMAKMKWIRLFR